MIRLTFPHLTLLLMLAAAAPLLAGIQHQAGGLPQVEQDPAQDEQPADDRPEVKELLERFQDHIGERGRDDDLAVKCIFQLRAEFKLSGPRDRKDIAKALYRAMKVKRKISRQGIRQQDLYFAAAEALGQMAPESVRDLIRLVGDRNHRDDYEVQVRILAALGRTQDERAVKPLLDVLGEYQARLQAGAAGALGNFTNLDQKERKEIFQDLLQMLCEARSDVQSEPGSSTAQDRWSRIASPAQSSMRKLSGADLRGPEEWRRWWNKNKRRDWGDGAAER